jgi:hypothetical protein
MKVPSVEGLLLNANGFGERGRSFYNSRSLAVA